MDGAGLKPEPSSGRIVRGQQPRRERTTWWNRAALVQWGVKDAFDRSPRDPAGPQQHRTSTKTSDNCRLNADPGWSAIDHEVDLAREIRQHVIGAGRGQMARTVRRGGHDRSGNTCQDGLGDRVIGYSHRNRVEPGGRERTHRAADRLGGDDGECAWPEGGGQPLRHRVQPGKLSRRDHVGHMGDQWIKRRPALGGVQPGHRLGILGICAQAIDGLRRKGDERPCREPVCCRPRPRGIRLHHARHHTSSALRPAAHLLDTCEPRHAARGYERRNACDRPLASLPLTAIDSSPARPSVRHAETCKLC